jgi:hypothetical protein
MSLYLVTKVSKGWALSHCQPGWVTPLDVYKSKKAAVLTARLLAGRSGSVSVSE